MLLFCRKRSDLHQVTANIQTALPTKHQQNVQQLHREEWIQAKVHTNNLKVGVVTRASERPKAQSVKTFLSCSLWFGHFHAPQPFGVKVILPVKIQNTIKNICERHFFSTLDII